MNQLWKKLPFVRKDCTYEQALEYYQAGDFAQAIAEFQKLTADPKKSGSYYHLALFYIKESYLHLAFAYQHMGRYEEAIKNFTAAAQVYDYPDIYYHTGLCFCLLNEFEKAEENFRKAIELNLHYTAAIFLLGFTLVRVRRLDEAVGYFKQALEDAPQYADYHYFLGSVYGLGHNYDLAKREFQYALEINPHYAEAERKIALIEKVCAEREPGISQAGREHKLMDEFLRDFTLVPVNPTGVPGNTRQISTGMNIIDEAILFYERAVQLHPEYADLHHHLGVYYAKKGNYSKAEESFQKALQGNPHFIQAMIHLALVYQKMGKMDHSIQIFHQAIDLRPQYPDLHYHLGSLYAERDDWAYAQKEFEQALGLNPHYSECHLALAILFEKQDQKNQALQYWRLYLKDCCHPVWREQIQGYLRRTFEPESKEEMANASRLQNTQP